MKLTPLPALTDNYIWMLQSEQHALVIDPGVAEPVLEALQRHQLKLDCIVVTHHHADHTGGVAALREATGARVVGPALETIPQPAQDLHDGDTFTALGLTFNVFHVPGHTAGHIALYCENVDGNPLLFCGDTLFSGGCGRLFEGTPAQMLHSLQRLSALPGNTHVCCTHEYTLSNLRFARAVEPHNAALAAYQQKCQALRAQGHPTLPSTIAVERDINPFLRTHWPDVEQAVRQHNPALAEQAGIFAGLREWKNNYQ